jgi:hypothetical protein
VFISPQLIRPLFENSSAGMMNIVVNCLVASFFQFLVVGFTKGHKDVSSNDQVGHQNSGGSGPVRGLGFLVKDKFITKIKRGNGKGEH